MLTDGATMMGPCPDGSVLLRAPGTVKVVGMGRPGADPFIQFFLGSSVSVSDPTEGVVW